jgi:hypothetical protein
VHELKQNPEIVSIDEGRQIDWSDEQDANASAPKLESLEPDSNVTCESAVQSRKQLLAIVSIDEGIQID